MAYIYKITNLINSKVYIGKTSRTIEERFQEHINSKNRIEYEKRPLYEAFNKYGIENFIIEEIEKVENDEIASQREIYWIEYYHSYIGFENCNGYNATLGGDSKRYYNYAEIANKYLELQNERKTAEFFNCDVETVKKACEENKIKMLSRIESIKKSTCKKVAKLDKDTLIVLQVYDSISDAFRDLKHNKTGGISDACKDINKTYLGFKWKYI